MRKAMLAAALAMVCACGAQAYQVYENFGEPHSTATITTDHVEYRVVVGAGELLEQFDFYVSHALGVPVGACYALDAARSPLAMKNTPVWTWVGVGYRSAFTADGSVSSALANQGKDDMMVFDPATGLGPGTYYFGYTIASGTYALVNTGWDCRGNGGSSYQTVITGQATGGGLGAVHGLDVVPEPTSIALIGLGAAMLALRRRKV